MMNLLPTLKQTGFPLLSGIVNPLNTDTGAISGLDADGGGSN